MSDSRNEIAAVQARLGHWRLEKRSADGRLFEVIEGEGEGPSRVTLRIAGVADACEYAWDLPMAREQE